VDFPKTAIHIMPVFDTELASAKICKGGNQLYEPMDQWFDLQKSDADKDLRRCDWSVWKTGKSVKTQYNAARMDPSPFTIDPAMEETAKQLVKKAMDDLRVPNEQLHEKMYGEAKDASLTAAAVVTVINPVQAAVVAPRVDDTPFQPSTQPVFVPNPVSQPAVSQAVSQAAPVASEQQVVLKGFIEWLSAQKEFQGSGMVNCLIPLVRTKLNGDINYHRLSAVEISSLQMFLASELSTLRTGK
jgi:hypothetical protein